MRTLTRLKDLICQLLIDIIIWYCVSKYDSNISWKSHHEFKEKNVFCDKFVPFSIEILRSLFLIHAGPESKHEAAKDDGRQAQHDLHLVGEHIP